MTCRAFYPEKCSSSPRYIFIAGSLATALPRFSYFTQSTPARKQKNMSHLIIFGFVLCFASNTHTHTHMLGFYECIVLIHELMNAAAVQGFVSFIFHSQADTAIGGRLDDKKKNILGDL